MNPLFFARLAAALPDLLGKDGQGRTGLRRFLMGAVIGISLFLTLLQALAQLFVTPISSLAAFFLPGSVVEAKRQLEKDFSMPLLVTAESGFMVLPTLDSAVSSYYGYRVLEGAGQFHEGVDFPSPFGSPVAAIAPGVVAECEFDSDYSSFILIRHTMLRFDEDDELIEAETFYSLYAHLYRVYVFEGQTVEQGRQIALSGGDHERHYAGRSTGAHLHLELRRTPQPQSHFDPYPYLFDPHPYEGKTKRIAWSTG